MDAGCIPTKDAVNFVGSHICKNIKKELRHGIAKYYLPGEKKWMVQMDEPVPVEQKWKPEDKLYLDFVDLFKGKDLYEATSQLVSA